LTVLLFIEFVMQIIVHAQLVNRHYNCDSTGTHSQFYSLGNSTAMGTHYHP